MTNDNTIKELIADSFKKHFSHYGFKKTSVDEIAKELKLSKKTIYQHFSTKEKIFYYIVSKVAYQKKNQMEEELFSHKSYEKKIKNLINIIFAETRQWLKTNDSFEFKYKYEIAKLAFKEAFNELFSQYIQEGIRAKEFEAKDIEITIRFINGIISEGMELLHVKPETDIEKEIINSILKLLK